MSQILIYQSEDGRTKLNVRLENQTLWLNQKQLTNLFGKAKGTISEHIKHIFEDGELEETSVVRQFRTTAADGKAYMGDCFAASLLAVTHLFNRYRIGDCFGLRPRSDANFYHREARSAVPILR